MVPGEFTTVIPFLLAVPLCGLIWASYPSGIAIDIPVGILTDSLGCRWIGFSILAEISTPLDPTVAYSGILCFEEFLIGTIMSLVLFLLAVNVEDWVLPSDFSDVVARSVELLICGCTDLSIQHVFHSSSPSFPLLSIYACSHWSWCSFSVRHTL